MENTHSHRKLFLELGAYIMVSTLFFLIAYVETQAQDNHMNVQRFTLDRFAQQATNDTDETPFDTTTGSAAEPMELPTGYDTLTYRSTQYTTEPFSAIGVRWTGVLPDSSEEISLVDVTIHATNSDGSVDRVLPPLGDDRKGPEEVGVYVTKPVMVDNATSFSVDITLTRADNGASPIISSFEIISLDSTRPNSSTTRTRATTAVNNAGVDIITREEWGADESLRLLKDGTELWPSEYADPEVFIVHHTAGTDGGEDPSATIRAIYFWHTVVLGWGDIGYNYLIDPNGNVYEGRDGGDGVIGAHTYNDVEDINYNVGTIGISLLGCFEETPGACYTAQAVTEEMNIALESLIATKAAELKLNPASVGVLFGEETPRVIGHRDVDYTYCPGSMVHNNLTTTRQSAKQRYLNLVSAPYRAQYKTLTLDEIIVTSFVSDTTNIQSTHTLSLTYKNTGTETWLKDELYLKVYNGTGKGRTVLADASWSDVFGKMQMTQDSVAPGQRAQFDFSIKGPKRSGSKVITVKLYRNGTLVQRSKKQFTFNFTRSYEAANASATVPVALLAGSSLPIDFSFTNTGTMSWDNTVKLVLNGTTAASVSGTVAPQETVTLSTNFTAPLKKKQAIKRLVVQLTQNNTPIAGSRRVYIYRVD